MEGILITIYSFTNTTKLTACNKWRHANSVFQDGAPWQNNHRPSSFMFTRTVFFLGDIKLNAFHSPHIRHWLFALCFSELGAVLPTQARFREERMQWLRQIPLDSCQGKQINFPSIQLSVKKDRACCATSPYFHSSFLSFNFVQTETRHWSKVIWKWHLGKRRKNTLRKHL